MRRKIWPFEKDDASDQPDSGEEKNDRQHPHVQGGHELFELQFVWKHDKSREEHYDERKEDCVFPRFQHVAACKAIRLFPRQP
ncbi:MAG: hypothetical protein H5U22_10905 [Rhizobium sp.]|nr:hypothetical protein [Rhizobium sp.]MBW8298822.1 hypothetical protein [Hydrogenophaga sp.]